MNVSFKIDDLKGFSVNKAYRVFSRGKRIAKIKSEGYREFEKEFERKLLERYETQIENVNHVLACGDYYLCADYRFYFPVFTKGGSIHKRAGDVDDLVKTSQDCLFKHLDADDSEIIQVTATKIHSEKLKIAIDLSVKELTHLH